MLIPMHKNVFNFNYYILRYKSFIKSNGNGNCNFNGNGNGNGNSNGDSNGNGQIYFSFFLPKKVRKRSWNDQKFSRNSQGLRN